MTVIERIFAELNKQGKSQIELARYLGIAKNTVTNWKLGISQSYMKFLPQIAKYLNVPIDSLVSDDPPLPKPQFGIRMSDSYAEPTPNDNLVNIDKIKTLAKSQGIKLNYLAAQIGVPHTYFADIKNKNRDIPDSRLAVIAELLSTTTDYLRDKSDCPDTPATPAELQDLISRTRSLSAEEIKELDDYLNFIISKRK